MRACRIGPYAGGESLPGDAPQRRIEVLGPTTSSVCNFPGAIDDHYIRCGRDLIGACARALVIIQRAKWRLVLLQVAPNSGWRLVHRHVDADELHGRVRTPPLRREFWVKAPRKVRTM